MSPYLFMFLYLFVCGLYLVRMRHSPEKGNRVIFKVLPIGMLLAATISALSQRVVLTIKNPQFLPRVYTLGGGLLFHCLAFIYYEFSSLFAYSSISYSVALAIYVYGFSGSFQLFKEFNSFEVSILVGILTFSLLVYLYLLPKLHLSAALLFGLQLILESLFLTVQVVLVSRYFMPYLYLGAAGALVLYISDVMSTICMYRGPLVPYMESFSMAINYLGSLMITGSIILEVL